MTDPAFSRTPAGNNGLGDSNEPTGSSTGADSSLESADLGEKMAIVSISLAETGKKTLARPLFFSRIEAFITKRFGDPPYYSNGVAGTLPEHTARAAPFVKATRRFLEIIYREGYGYKKVGVQLYDIRPKRPHQKPFWEPRYGPPAKAGRGPDGGRQPSQPGAWQRRGEPRGHRSSRKRYLQTEQQLRTEGVDDEAPV